MPLRDAAAHLRRVLAQKQPSHAAGISDAVVIKDSELYFLCLRDGSVPLDEGHGLGLYCHDCRFLSGYELRVCDALLEPLAANGEDGFRSVFRLTNPSLGRVGTGIARQQIGVRWRHVIDAEHWALRDDLTIENYDTEPHSLSLTIALQADFRDVFAIRGTKDERPGTLRPIRWEDQELVFSYEGGDERLRELRVLFSEEPARKDEGRTRFELRLGPHETRRIIVSLSIVETNETTGRSIVRRSDGDVRSAEAALERSMSEWMRGFVTIRSPAPCLERAVDRALRDLRALRMTLDEHRFFAAGVPWFSTLFGRDSLVCALQTLAYRPEIAAETLRLLADFQGNKCDPSRDEEPGKILHEFRVGELSAMGIIPHNPYYGTVDATPLFLIVLAEYMQWTGDLGIFRELEDAVEGALRWLDDFGDHDGDGYVDYEAEEGQRLINQGWKDSGGAIVDSCARHAEGPIALVEEQGYVYKAKRLAASMFERSGDTVRAGALRTQARALRERFNRDFWMPEKGFYALALERGGRQIDAISSNPGQALWTGIIDGEHAAPVVERLMSEDLYSGWGIRTLSAKERAYNPVGYHLGAVWPHDNAFIAAGFRQYGFDGEATRVFSDLLRAATHFEHNQLPEVLAGYSREEFGVPVRYPVACHPQAWASGSIPYLLQVVLGIEPDGYGSRLRVVRPCLPSFVGSLTLERLRVGRAEVDLSFERTSAGDVSVRVERLSGKLEITVDPGFGEHERNDRKGVSHSS